MQKTTENAVNFTAIFRLFTLLDWQIRCFYSPYTYLDKKIFLYLLKNV